MCAFAGIRPKGVKTRPPSFFPWRLQWGLSVFQWGFNPHNPPPANFYPDHSRLASVASIIRGRGSTGSRGSVDPPPAFSCAGSTCGAWPVTLFSFTCAQSVAVYSYSFIQLLLFNSPQIIIVPKDLKLKSNNSTHIHNNLAYLLKQYSNCCY